MFQVCEIIALHELGTGQKHGLSGPVSGQLYLKVSARCLLCKLKSVMPQLYAEEQAYAQQAKLANPGLQMGYPSIFEPSVLWH